MWAEKERTGLLLGGPATPTPTMLAEATVVPRAVLDLGLGVDVQEGALLVAALPCRESQTHIHLGQLEESWTQTHLGFSQGRDLLCGRGPGASGVASWPGES